MFKVLIRQASAFLIFTVIFCSLFAVKSMTATTIYVSKAGSDTNTGFGRNYPRLTVGEAINDASSGDTVYDMTFSSINSWTNPDTVKQFLTIVGTTFSYNDSVKAAQSYLGERSNAATKVNNKTTIKDDIVMIAIFCLCIFALYKKNKRIQNSNNVKDKKFFKGVFVFVSLLILLVLAYLTIDLFHLLSM